VIWRRHLETEGFNQELFDEILHRAQTTPSFQSANHGGWRSPEDLLTWPLPAITVLHSMVWEAFDEVSGEKNQHKQWLAWAVVNRNGSYHARHGHNGKWVGIYYVTSGSGDTVFEIPGGIERITPHAGLLVVTPANIFHSVEPCTGGSPRITIGFEAR
jgi:hypothetical protein